MTDEQLHEEGAARGEASDEPWTPPEKLPRPAEQASGSPVVAIGAGLAVAVACGAGLWVSSQLFYVYILYNALIGSALGWALGLAPRRAGFTNVAALTAALVALAAVPYVVMRYGFYLQLAPDLRAQGFDPSFLQFFQLFLENDSLFGMELGLIGNLAVLLVEIGITVHTGRGALAGALAEARIASVPPDVVRFVVEGLAHGWDTATLKSELARRGWTRAEDQDRAIGTGFDLISAMQRQQG